MKKNTIRYSLNKKTKKVFMIKTNNYDYNIYV